MNSLESLKQLLVAESELNRAQLVGDLAALTADAHAFADRAKTLGSIVSSATTLALGLSGYRCRKAAASAAKLSWLQTILKGAGVISTLWTAFQRQSHDRDGF